MIKNNVVDHLKEEIMCYQHENEQLELEVESKIKKIEKLEKLCMLSKERESNNEKNYMTVKKECVEKLQTIDAAMKLKSQQLVDYLNRR